MATAHHLYRQKNRRFLQNFAYAGLRAHNENRPIFSLPPEILTQIFKHTLEDNPSPGSVLLHGAICSKWRETAWSCSGLWSKIRIDFEYSEYEPVRIFKAIDLELLNEWMLRTGTTRLLTLTITCWRSMYSLRAPYKCPFIEPTQLLRFICDHRRRWESLTLCIPRGWFKRLDKFDFPHLKDIKFFAFDLIPSRGSEPITIDLSQWKANSLQTVDLHSVRLQSVNLPWSQLLRVSFADVRPEPFLNILPILTNAVEIRVALLWLSYRPPPSWNTRTQPFILPAVQRLWIECENSSFLTALLSKLVTRNLKCFTFGLFKWETDFLPAAITGLVAQSRLKQLTLEVDYKDRRVMGLQAMEIREKLAKMAMIPIELKVETAMNHW